MRILVIALSKRDYFDYPHGNIQYNHWHGWGGPGLTNRSKGDHWSYLELIWWMFGGM